jgi:hypothetical protein
MDIGHIAPLFLIGIGIAAFGWGMVRISARIERRRAARHVVKYGHSNIQNTTRYTALASGRFKNFWRD